MVSMSGVSVVVVGDTKCGKTQLINRFANRTFDQVTIFLYFKFPACVMYGVAVLWYYYVHNPPLVYTNTNRRTDTSVFLPG